MCSSPVNRSPDRPIVNPNDPSLSWLPPIPKCRAVLRPVSLCVCPLSDRRGATTPDRRAAGDTRVRRSRMAGVVIRAVRGRVVRRREGSPVPARVRWAAGVEDRLALDGKRTDDALVRARPPRDAADRFALDRCRAVRDARCIGRGATARPGADRATRLALDRGVRFAADDRPRLVGLDECA